MTVTGPISGRAISRKKDGVTTTGCESRVALARKMLREPFLGELTRVGDIPEDPEDYEDPEEPEEPGK